MNVKRIPSRTYRENQNNMGDNRCLMRCAYLLVEMHVHTCAFSRSVDCTVIEGTYFQSYYLAGKTISSPSEYLHVFHA